MCGLTGIFAFNLIGKINKIHVTAATMAISSRGPDHQDIYNDEWVALGHRRLSIIDTRDIANQPMWDENGRFAIIFNGEIFNFKELKRELVAKGVVFRTESDTEVLLKLFMRDREVCLSKLNGFFAFCIYDKEEQSLFIARDRFGIKPLIYLFDEDKFIFASEMKAILSYGLEKHLDHASLLQYLQLNFIPAPHTIFTNVKKLLPGHYLKVKRSSMEIGEYYTIPYDRDGAETNGISYGEAKKKLAVLLEESVKKRLIADVPLGAFLSGGIDSSIVAGLASRHQSDFHTFSIGFRDEKFFDETDYARLVAKHYGTSHTVFSLTNADLYKHLHAVLNHTDEPFADSSGIALYILSKETRKHATVALSGDGADELLAGYNKHHAAFRVLHPGLAEAVARMTAPLTRLLPQSRNNAFSNKVRQLIRYADGARLNAADRYWRWATFADHTEALSLLHPTIAGVTAIGESVARRSGLLSTIPSRENINDILLTDMKFVLPNDMLTKVDLMSMAHGLEVRAPFLDYEVVNFIFSLPDGFKINRGIRKRILQDAFRDMLPAQLYNRPKKGFEVPMLKWLRTEMRSLIEDDLLSRSFIEQQQLFNYAEVEKLKKRLFSSNPGDVHARIWGLVVFQWWWRKYVNR